MPNIRPFVDTLRDIERGNLLDELAQQQHRIVQKVLETNGVGELAVVLKYKTTGRGQISIEACIKQKTPAYPRGQSLFFITPEGNLDRNDTRQAQLPFGRPDTAPTPTINTEVKNNG